MNRFKFYSILLAILLVNLLLITTLGSWMKTAGLPAWAIVLLLGN